MTAPAGTPTETLEDRVKQAELQLRLATAESSIRDLKADKQLPTIPDLTDRTPTISDNGGAAAASLAAIEVVASAAGRVAIAVRGVTKQGDTIVMLEDAAIAPRLGAAYEVRARTRSLTIAVRRLNKANWNVALAFPVLQPPGPELEAIAPDVPAPSRLPGPLFAVAPGFAAPSTLPGPLSTIAPQAGQAMTFAIDLLDALSPKVTLSGRELPTTSTALRAKLAGELASGAVGQQRTVIASDQATVLASRAFRDAKDLALLVDALRSKALTAQAKIVPFTTRLEALRAERDLAYSRFLDAVADSKEGNRDALGAEVERLDTAIRMIQEVRGYRALSTLVSRATATIAAVDAYLTAVTTRVDGVSPLQAAALAELITGELDLGNDLKLRQPTDRYLLYSEVVMAAGDVLTTTSLFETSIRASGAAQIVYRLTDIAGRVVASGEEHDVKGRELINDKLRKLRAVATLGITLLLIFAITVAAIALLLNVFK